MQSKECSVCVMKFLSLSREGEKTSREHTTDVDYLIDDVDKNIFGILQRAGKEPGKGLVQTRWKQSGPKEKNIFLVCR